MMNEDHVPGATVEVDLAPIGKPRTVHVFRLDGALERGQEIADGGVQKIPVPTDDVSAALIVSAVSPELEAVAWLEQIMRPGTDGAMLAVFFPVQEPKGLAHRLVWPQGFQPEEKSIPAETDCLQRTEFFVPLGLKDLKRWDKARATITWTGGQTSAWAMLAPPLVNGDMEEVEEGRLVYWGPPPCNENPGRGKYCIRVDRQISPHGHFSSLTPLKPGCKYRFKGMVKRSGEKGAGAHVIEYEEKLNFVRSAALNSTKRGEWETVETVFTTHRNPRSTAIYLYNFDEKSPAWFDALELEELPPER
jgi:hypothetical protein